MKSFYAMPASEFSSLVVHADQAAASEALLIVGLADDPNMVSGVLAWASLQPCGVLPDNALKAAKLIAHYGWNASWSDLAARYRRIMGG